MPTLKSRPGELPGEAFDSATAVRAMQRFPYVHQASLGHTEQLSTSPHVPRDVGSTRHFEPWHPSCVRARPPKSAFASKRNDGQASERHWDSPARQCVGVGHECHCLSSRWFSLTKKKKNKDAATGQHDEAGHLTDVHVRRHRCRGHRRGGWCET